MLLLVNGEERELPISTLSELTTLLGYSGKTFAVAVDGEHVPQGSWDEFKLTQRQNVLILAPMSGG
ncbi:MAG: sulfur carrier protein ThiS [Candidatus Melainabacteria bacterium]|nr:sulfur carrier protein ThiS [Candidatus Melainabacteria bacterium]